MITFTYVETSKWFGLRRRAEQLETSTMGCVWVGPWRFTREAVRDDIVGHCFDEFMGMFATEELSIYDQDGDNEEDSWF